MQCPTCRADNRETRRFCGACGGALPLPCPTCGFANEPQAHFCGGCGGALPDAAAMPPPHASPAPEVPGERRQVTVLFADLAGFTGLAQALDAEELHAVMSRFFGAIDRVVTGYGGSVDKHIGDAVMAVFGAPVAHGDDPMRAARAAIDIHAAVSAVGGEINRPLAIHVGIASGEVVAAGLGSDRHRAYTVLGDAVNLAARLVEMAKANETLLSDSARRLIAPLADCTPLGAVELHGFESAVHVWRLEALRAEEATAGAAPFVGRIAERRQIAGLLDTVRETGRGTAVLLRGEAGIGKTRLVEEITVAARASGIAVHLARVLDFGTATGHDPARMLMRTLLGLDAASDADRRQAAAAAAIADGWLAADRRPFLLDLLDLPQPQAERTIYDAMDNATRNRSKQQTLVALIHAAAERGPLLLVVEDIHWADPATLAHLAAIAVAALDVPAALVMTTRIEGDPLNESWRAAMRAGPLVTIDMGPLGRDEALALAASFLDATNGAALACVERAEGNPLFVEQLLRHAEVMEETGIPATIQSLVLSRADRLAPADRQALQAAAAIGQQFTLDLLRHLIDDPVYDAAPLMAHHLMRPTEDGFLFAHALIRDGVYGALLKPRRRELHARAAAWFANRDPVLMAQHLDRADDPGAAAAYLAAAQYQAQRHHYESALTLAERGFSIADDAARHALACRRGALLLDLGRTAESIDAFENALALAETDGQRCQAWIGLAGGLRVADRYDEALDALDRAEAVAADRQSDIDLAHIHYLRGNLCFPLGRIDDCRRAHELALDHARRAGSAEAEARALSGLGDAHYAAGRMLTAGAYFEDCVALAAEHGFGRIEVANRSMAALTRLFACDLDAALAGARQAIEAAVAVGHQRAEMVANEIAHLVLFETGDLDQAEIRSGRALELSRRLGARRFEAEDLTFLAQIRRCRGQRTDALALLDQALAISREVGMEYIGALILAEIAATTDDGAQREAALAEGEAELDRGAVSHAYLWFYRCAMDVRLENGDWAAAERLAQAFADYAQIEPTPWSEFYVARARALAAWGKGLRTDAVVAELNRLAALAARHRLGRALIALKQVVAAA
jgi:class 3 adenylate cyclase/tetratricopeptide (TPR) repeat protein